MTEFNAAEILKQSSHYNTVTTNDDTRWAPHPAHRCDANLPELHGEDGAHSTVHPGGSGCPIQDAQTSSKAAGTQPAQKGYNNSPDYTNIQQGLHDSGILRPLTRHAGFLAVEFILPKRANNAMSLLSKF